MKSSTYLSLGLLVAVVAWMLSGAVNGVPDAESVTQEPATKAQRK